MIKEFTFIASDQRGLYDTETKGVFFAVQSPRMAKWADLEGRSIMYQGNAYISMDDLYLFYDCEEDVMMKNAVGALRQRAADGFFDTLPSQVAEVANGCSDQPCEAPCPGCGE